ncbi:hypothetical protein C1645_826333 [Glomus cerebriforme]|uniref:Coenzyme Q-binding protein COQ10 START domain-containing protein n=1 Tax=Glomus cerebriforme TaxID=658196 RepID=A0A397SRR9_9GLOM|nr:hypothetical protein C1645_826333 [Glomus cerebriforme]
MLLNLTNALKSALKVPQRTFFNGLSFKKTYNGHKVIGYTQRQLYDVVSNIDEYKNFIPYCTHSIVVKTQNINNRNKKLTAILGVGFDGYDETYASEVICERPGFVRAEAAPNESLFKQLSTVWELTPHHDSPSTHCNLNFHLEFEFSSFIYSQLANVFFDNVSTLMVDAFERRCYTLYGPPAPPILTIKKTD